MTRHDLIRELVAGCADSHPVTVPAGWLRELLGDGDPMEPSVPTKDLDAHDLAAHYGRSVKTIRAWLAAGVFPQAYRTPAGWRVPKGALRHVQQKQPQGNREPRAASPEACLDVQGQR